MANDVLKTLLAEAYGEGPEAMRRVAEVILNRAAVKGLTPEQVVREANQFTGLTHPGSEALKTWSDPKALTAAQAAWDLAQQPGDPTGGADHYHTTDVNPGWASKMPSTGQYGSHLFYASRPIPPGELPQVGSLTDTVRPAPPPPATLAPELAAMRAITSPSGGNSELQSALERMAAVERNRVTPQTRAAQPLPSLTMPGAINASVGGLKQDAALAAALARRGGAFGDDPGTPASGPVVASFPTKPAPKLSSGPVSYAGQTDKPSRNMFSGDPGTPAAGRVVAVLPTRKLSSAPVSYAAQDAVRSPVGQPPATRKVQSVPMPAPARAQTYAAQDAVPSPRSSAVPSGVTRIASIAGSVPMPAGVRPVVPSTQPAKPQQTELQRQAAIYARGGPTRPTSAPVIPDRLAASAGLPALYGEISPAQVNRTGVALTEQVNPAGRRVTALPVQVARNTAPVPLPASARPLAVGTQMDVAPPMPVTRSVIGAAPVAQVGAAPTPMPRLQRPGIFGRPQIFGHDIKLPGVLGLLQNATMVMNNASGPFNNGGDNAIYNMMRGGDYNTPGAATHQGRSGYLFAARPGGGFINVGRANPNISAAEMYASRLRRNDAGDDAANRVNGSRNASGGAPDSLIDR